VVAREERIERETKQVETKDEEVYVARTMAKVGLLS
jgi:hypothetical protein